MKYNLFLILCLKKVKIFCIDIICLIIPIHCHYTIKIKFNQFKKDFKIIFCIQIKIVCIILKNIFSEKIYIKA